MDDLDKCFLCQIKSPSPVAPKVASWTMGGGHGSCDLVGGREDTASGVPEMQAAKDSAGLTSECYQGMTVFPRRSASISVKSVASTTQGLLE